MDAHVQVEALERELAELRQARGIRLYGLPSRADIFASLGLERWREERLLPPAASSLDLEAAAANKKDRCASPASPRRLAASLTCKDVWGHGKLALGRKCVSHLKSRLRASTTLHDRLSACRGDSSHRQLFSRDVGPAGLRGQVSLRTWIIIIYLVLLHVAVMLSFTQQHDAHAACQDHVLPGT